MGVGVEGSVARISQRPGTHVDALFVQSATALTSSAGTMTLHGLTASTVYFADRPRREVGHILSRRFGDLWQPGSDAFADAPPRAVVSFLDEGGGEPDDVVLVLREPLVDGNRVTYRVDVLEGALPARCGACVLFIEVFARPLSPLSLAPRDDAGSSAGDRRDVVDSARAKRSTPPSTPSRR
jgi:hypothetical protein